MESEASLWSQEVGGRLRMLQASFAEDSPATREKYLVEEIERSLKGIGESIVVIVPEWVIPPPICRHFMTPFKLTFPYLTNW